MARLKKGDLVQVISGRSQARGGDRGKQGKVIAVLVEKNRVLVEGINFVTKHVRVGQTQRGTKTGGIETHEEPLRDRLEATVTALPGVTCWSRASTRTSTLPFTFAGRDPQDVRNALADKGINAPAGNFYAIECSRRLGLGDDGGLRLGLAPYTDDEDVDRAVEALTAVLGG